MAGTSITSSASSFFNKLRGKSNPYEKTLRDQSHIASTCVANLSPPITRSDNDLLAEARQAAGRDPVTGRRRTEVADQTSVQQRPVDPRSPGQTAGEQRAANLTWAAQRPQEGGRPYGSYEEFVQEMVERRYGRRDAAGNLLSYYAPERRVEEFYSGGVRY